MTIISPLPSRIILLFELWKGWQLPRCYKLPGAKLSLLWRCSVSQHLCCWWHAWREKVAWFFLELRDAKPHCFPLNRHELAICLFCLWCKSLSMVILRDSRINPVFKQHVLPSIARALRRNCWSHGGIWLAHLSGARGALSLAWPVRSQFFSDQLIVQSWLKLPARSQQKESRTRNDVIPENSRLRIFRLHLSNLVSILPSFESRSLKHFRATFSAAGPNSQTLPWPMKPAWYRTSPYAALVSYWNEGEIDGNRIGAEAPATWCNKFSASSRASLAAARFSAGVRVSATLFACQIE